MNTEQERAAFEAWCRERYNHPYMERNSDGYISTATHPFISMTYASVQMLWEAWQARAALQMKEATSKEVGSQERRVMPPLRDLTEHNLDRAREWYGVNDPSPSPNGLACPKCGSELLDSNPMETLASLPPQKRVHCAECDFTGYRVA